MCVYDEWAGYQDQGAHKLLTDTRERYFWQSLAGLRDPPNLTDIPALARAIRTPA